MYKKRNTTGIIGTVITTIILILVVVFSNINESNLSFIERLVGSIVMPIQNGFTYLKNKTSGNTNFFTDIDNLKQENDELKRKNSELEQSLRELEIIKADNLVLQEYAKMLDKYSEYETIPAYIISKDISNFDSIFVINVGSEDGVEKNMPVISENGLVEIGRAVV